MNAIILDTETTGRNEPEAIEIAYLRMQDVVSLRPAAMYHNRFKPSKPIETGAMAVHHIMDEDLVDCAPSRSFSLPADVAYIIGHNIDYDWGALGKPEVKRICTCALARSIWPNADSHGQSSLLYMLERAQARTLTKNAHSATTDVENCHKLLTHIMRELPAVSTWEELYQHSEESRIPKIMPFGKHRGTPIAQLPADYKAWLLKQPDMDPYVIKAVKS